MAQEFTDEQLNQAMEDFSEDQSEDMEENRLLSGTEWQEGYGPPEPEERHNAHTFLAKAVFDQPNTLKTTFLTEGELGRPDFSVRFLASIKTVAEDLIDPLAKHFELENGVAHYFGEKMENITASGLSNKGFSMNMNVTRKMDATRKRVRDPVDNFKGGQRKI
ncbi:hypothetical protein LCGC14_0937100 [marine sediment metagenome]|uniref:Uncharacterized protein n=1 Tax=marine sediment metagenome TaxID=412755 RepID=A0A0F9RSM7_9ZZZZ